jgi:hypothetical protein
MSQKRRLSKRKQKVLGEGRVEVEKYVVRGGASGAVERVNNVHVP